jgi:hypothetical protein
MTTPSSWTNISFLKASTPVANSFMGGSCAVYGNIAVLGASSENSNTGAVYIFSKNTTTGVWSQQQKLVGAASGDNFGFSVSLYNDTLVVGAYSLGSDTVGEYVNIYRLSGTTWNLERNITNPNPTPAPAPGDNFGYAVSVYNNTLAICAPGYTTSPGNSEGAVYIYTRSGTTWTLQTPITNSPALQNNRYAWSVSLYETTMAVGVQFESTTAANSGAVYIYTGSGASWTRQQIIKASTPVGSSGFGNSVALYGDILAVGTLGSITNGAYAFTRSGTTWTQRQILTPTTPGTATAAGFGNTVAIYDTIIVVGARFDNGNATGVNGTNTSTLTGAGAAYAYVTADAGTTWTQNAYMKASAIPTPVANDNAATSVAIYGTIILSGAPGQDTGGSSSGAGYLYEPVFIPPPIPISTATTIVVDPCCTFTNCIRVSLPTMTQDSVITETHEAKTILAATNTLYNGISNGTITSNPNPTFGSYREYMLYIQGKLKFVNG